MIYHLALCIGTYEGRHLDSTLILEARRSIDFLSCEAWKYLGQREVTKAHLRKHRVELLDMFNRQYGTAYKHLLID